MKQKQIILSIFIFLNILCSNNILYSYDFASVAKDIKKQFDQQNIISDFGRELYSKIDKATNNFSKNLDYNQLSSVVPELYTDYMVNNLIKSDNNIYLFVIWPILSKHYKSIEFTISKYSKIIGKKSVDLNHNGQIAFLKQIKSAASGKLARKEKFDLGFSNLSKLKSKEVRIYIVKPKKILDTDEEMYSYLNKIYGNNILTDYLYKNYGKSIIYNLYSNIKCKRVLRKIFKNKCAAHVDDLPSEVLETASLLFNKNSINHLNFCNINKIKFQKNYNDFVTILKKRMAKKLDDVVIYNGGVLASYGLRDCHDLDFWKNNRSIAESNFPSWTGVECHNKPGLNYVILEDFNGNRYIQGSILKKFGNINIKNSSKFVKKVSIDDLLYNPKYYFHFNKVRYATLEFMRFFKEKRGRDKDNKDIKMIDQMLANFK